MPPLARSATLLAVLLAGCATHGDPAAPTLGLADVSVLMPLPAAVDDPGLLRFDSPGAGGPLLDAPTFSQLTDLVFNGTADPSLGYATWRVVAARIDPCFPSLGLLTTAPDRCRHQLRLVAQPIAAATTGTASVTVADDGIHLLYDLPEAEFTALARDWVALATARSSDRTRAFGVHVELASEGLAGPTATALRQLILAHAGPATLLQVTFMNGRSVAWQFAGLKLTGGLWAPLAIPGVSGPTQTFTSDNLGVFDFQPASAQDEALRPLAGTVMPGPVGGGTVTLTAAPAAVTAALTASLASDDPTLRDADHADCASCHAASRARARALTLGASDAGLPRFAGTGFNLDLVGLGALPTSTQQQRSLGYNDQAPVWNQRLVNESAAVAEAVAQWLAAH